MSPRVPTLTPIKERVIAELTRCGSMSVTDLGRALRVRKGLPQALASLYSGGLIVKNERFVRGVNRRRRPVTTYSLSIDGSDGGTWQPEEVLREAEPAGGGSAADAAADAEAGHGAVCPGCGEPWAGPGWCPACAPVGGWHP